MSKKIGEHPLATEARGHDQELRELRGISLIAGIDEVGRGSLAGPVTVASCIMPLDHGIQDIRDSKIIAKPVLKRMAVRIREKALNYAVVHAPAERIDELGMIDVLKKLFLRSILSLKYRPDLVLIDGHDHLSEQEAGLFKSPCMSIANGDKKSEAIAAASIIAKATRDIWMQKTAHPRFPQYDFINNVGYGTPKHIEALMRGGPCELHRMSFKLKGKKIGRL